MVRQLDLSRRAVAGIRGQRGVIPGDDTDAMSSQTVGWAAAQEQPGALWAVATVLAGIGAFWLYKRWKSSRDRPLAETLCTTGVALSLIWIASSLTIPKDGPTWLGEIVLWGPVPILVALPAAGGIQAWRDRRAGVKLRAELGLAPRRRMLRPWALVALWVVGVLVALMMTLWVAATVLTLTVDDPKHRFELSQTVGMASVVPILIGALACWIHVLHRRKKIAEEDERLRRMDLGLDDEDDSNTTL